MLYNNTQGTVCLARYASAGILVPCKLVASFTKEEDPLVNTPIPSWISAADQEKENRKRHEFHSRLAGMDIIKSKPDTTNEQREHFGKLIF